MIQVSISATDMEVLQEERYTHPHPRVQRKLHALYWVGLGLPRHVVARMVGVSEGTLRNDLHAYEQGGLEALRPCNPHPTSAALHAYTDTIRQTVIAEPPHPVQEAIERIEALTGIRRSPTAVRTWLKKRVWLSGNGAHPGQSRPRRAATLLGDSVRAGSRRSPGRDPAWAFCRCRPLRPRSLVRLSVVSGPRAVADALRASTLPWFRSSPRDNP